MSRPSRSRRLIVIFTALALLLQGVVAVACGLHDAGHAVEAAIHGHAADDHRQHPEQADEGWHALFHAGHHCQHLPVPPPYAGLRLAAAPALPLAIARVRAAPDVPPGLLFRPPIAA